MRQKVEIISSSSCCSDESLAELPAELREELSCLGAWVREGRMAGDRREEREVLEEEEGGLLRRERRSREEEEEGLREVEQLTDNMRLTARELEEEVGGRSVASADPPLQDETLPLTTDSARLEDCTAALRSGAMVS